MNNFEEQLDVIRVQLYEETKKMDKEDIITNVNSHAQKIAQEFGIKIVSTVSDSAFPPRPCELLRVGIII